MPDVSIAISAQDNFSTAIARMQNATRSFSKDAEGLDRKMTALNRNKATLSVDVRNASRALKEAQKAYDEIQSGKTTFNDLFTKYENNKSENKKPIAENLGVVPAENSGLVQEFVDGLKPLKEGEISKPIKTQFGYHLIKVDTKNEAKEILSGYIS